MLLDRYDCWPPRLYLSHKQRAKTLISDAFIRKLRRTCCKGDLRRLHTYFEQLDKYDLSGAPLALNLLPAAATNGHADILRYLFDTLPDCQRPLPWQHYYRQFCLPLKYDKDALHGDEQKGSGVGSVLLHTLKGANPPAILKVLIDYGLSVDHDLDKNTCLLSEAVRRKSHETVRFLLEHGANPKRHGLDSALTIAFKNDDAETVSLISKYATSIDENDTFAYAVAYRRIRTAKKLLELGTDINNVFATRVNRAGRISKVRIGTPLYRAINAPEDQPGTTCSLEEMIRFLLANGARTDIAGAGRKTPLQVARRKKREGALKVFEEFSITK